MNKRELTSKMKKLGKFIKENNCLESKSIENYAYEIFPEVCEFDNDENSMWFLIDDDFEGSVTKKQVNDKAKKYNSISCDKIIDIGRIIQIVIEIKETSIVISANIDIKYRDKYGICDTQVVDIKEIKIEL